MKKVEHRHKWFSIRKGYPQRICRCGSIMAPGGLKAGLHTITVDPGGLDVMRWSASGVPAAAGDLGMNQTDGRPQAFVGGAASALIALGEYMAMGLVAFGTGADGSLSLGANTTLTAGANIRNLTTLALNGFTLTQNTADPWIQIFANTSISLGGGVIQGQTGNGGSIGGPGGGGGGAGGTGPNRSTAAWVFTPLFTGTGSVSSNGVVGNTGANGGAATAVANGTVGGSPSDASFFGHPLGSVSAIGGGPGVSGGTGGLGGNSGGSMPARCSGDIIGYIHANGMDGSSSASTVSSRNIQSTSGAGGGGGGGNTGAQGAGGGGGGAGGSLFFSGSAGGAGGTGTAGATGTGGGGGAGGSGGAFAFVFTQNAPSTLTVSANGGGGGAGGNAGSANGGRGGGGSGGAGGEALLIAQPSNGAAVVAAGGSAGAAGSGTGVGGTNGTAGPSGVAANLPYKDA